MLPTGLQEGPKVAQENKAGRGANIVRRKRFGSKVQTTVNTKDCSLKASGCLGRTRWVVGDALNFSVPPQK